MGDLLEIYQHLLRTSPILTKSVTSSVISGLGSILSQVIAGKPISGNNLRAFLIFGGLVTGPTTHFFYILLDKLFPGPGLVKYVLRLLTDRLVFSPGFLLVTLYWLSRLQGATHQKTVESIESKYWPCLKGNWQIWTVPQIINIGFVPPQYRVLFGNMVALVWNAYLGSRD